MQQLLEYYKERRWQNTEGDIYIKTHATIMCPCVCNDIPQQPNIPPYPFFCLSVSIFSILFHVGKFRYLMTDSDCCWLSSPFCFQPLARCLKPFAKKPNQQTQWAKQMPIKMFHVEFWVRERRERETKADDSSLWNNAIHILAFPDEWPKQQHFVFVSTCSNCAGVAIYTNVYVLFIYVYTYSIVCAVDNEICCW